MDTDEIYLSASECFCCKGNLSFGWPHSCLNMNMKCNLILLQNLKLRMLGVTSLHYITDKSLLFIFNGTL